MRAFHMEPSSRTRAFTGTVPVPHETQPRAFHVEPSARGFCFAFHVKQDFATPRLANTRLDAARGIDYTSL